MNWNGGAISKIRGRPSDVKKQSAFFEKHKRKHTKGRETENEGEAMPSLKYRQNMNLDLWHRKKQPRLTDNKEVPTIYRQSQSKQVNSHHQVCGPSKECLKHEFIPVHVEKEHEKQTWKNMLPSHQSTPINERTTKKPSSIVYSPFTIGDTAKKNDHYYTGPSEKSFSIIERKTPKYCLDTPNTIISDCGDISLYASSNNIRPYPLNVSQHSSPQYPNDTDIANNGNNIPNFDCDQSCSQKSLLQPFSNDRSNGSSPDLSGRKHDVTSMLHFSQETLTPEFNAGPTVNRCLEFTDTEDILQFMKQYKDAEDELQSISMTTTPEWKPQVQKSVNRGVSGDAVSKMKKSIFGEDVSPSPHEYPNDLRTTAKVHKAAVQTEAPRAKATRDVCLSPIFCQIATKDVAVSPIIFP